MKPELNREYPELDDTNVFQHMINVTTALMKPVDGNFHRGQHAKTTGCVTAEFRIADDIPSDLRHGIFRQPGRTFSAIVRFSNAPGKFEKDGVGTARGLAIKLLDVAGARAVPDDGDTTQDFLMVNHPVFPFPNPKAYVETMSRKSIPLIGDVVAIAHLALLEPAELKVVKEIKDKHVSSPLGISYWSGSPYWLGPAVREGGHAVKYSAVPRPVEPGGPDHPEELPDDYLTRALAAGLQSSEAVFDFKVQLQTDPEAMPVEDVSVYWDEGEKRGSPPKTVATLRIPRQKVDPDGDLARKCESISFNPWHALAEHRPIGGMNRLRKVVYQASITKRGGNGNLAG